MTLALDALYAGDPVAACKAVGAEACLGYVWRPGGTGDWSRSKFDALRSAHLGTAPIFVPPGDGSLTWATIKAAAQAMGFGPGPIIGDLEGPYNLPPVGWWYGICNAAAADGWRPYLYGNPSDVSGYPKGAGWWQARYVQHSVQPVPQLPPGLAGWQYADQVLIGGVEFDASTIQEEMIVATVGLDPNDPVVAEVRQRLGDIANMLVFAPDVTVSGKQIHPRMALIADVYNLLSAVKSELDGLVAQGGAGGGGGIDLGQVADLLDAASAKARGGG